MRTVLKWLFTMGTTLVWWTGITLGCVWYQKTSGLPIVGVSKTVHVSKSRPFWNKWFILYKVWWLYSNSNDDLERRHTTQSIKRLQYYI
jgi:hypothetical protein